ncbi:protein TIFY 9-like isoform X1 [Cucurbita moschata]|uniref:Protein TIFY n=1 Tax=Cucurbita moschata TaxID=3662 RepID=A0A6J1GXZ7_CUCMO|nr:protein TIFY 9-like isoform X1 [Cucurbita moschata]
MSFVELDFFAMDSRSLNSDSNPTLFRRHRSFKDIQGAISKINPEILKSLIASGSTEHSSDFATPIPQKFPPLSLHRTPNVDQNLSTPPPVYSATTSRMSPVIASEKYPLTIFYNETVSVFHVSRDEAKNIMRFAEKASGTGTGIRKGEAEKGRPMAEITSNQNQQPVAIDPEDDEDLPLARKRSLQRFLERRKESGVMIYRLIPAVPYGCRF